MTGRRLWINALAVGLSGQISTPRGIAVAYMQNVNVSSTDSPMEHKWRHNTMEQVWSCPVCDVWFSGPSPIHLAMTIEGAREKIQERANQSGISEDCAQELVKAIMQS